MKRGGVGGGGRDDRVEHPLYVGGFISFLIYQTSELGGSYWSMSIYPHKSTYTEMELSLHLLAVPCLAIFVIVFLVMVGNLLFSWWVFPYWAYRKLRANGFSGPKRSFPLGNLNNMKRVKRIYSNSPSRPSSLGTSNDIHYTIFPYFAWWQKLYGKFFVYWLGTEPFVYIAYPEFLKQVSTYLTDKYSRRPNVFKHDRQPMIDSGLILVNGDEWILHRHLITPAFSPLNIGGVWLSLF